MRRLLTIALAVTAAFAVSPVAASAASAPPKAEKPAKPSKKALSRAHKGPVAKASLCSAPMAGDWHNINPNTSAMTRAVVDFTCNDVVFCPVGQPCTIPESFYSMRMFGQCHPTDCNWGRLRAYDMGDGWIRSIYSFGFKTSHVLAEDVQLLRADVPARVGPQRLHARRRPRGLHHRRVDAPLSG